MLISTNILRDGDLDFEYIVTDNSQKIFEALTNTEGRAAKCFNLIGSYGTGKSSFLVAFEQTLLGKQQFFETKGLADAPIFIKIVGSHASFRSTLARALNLHNNSSTEAVLAELESLAQGGKPVYLLVDELGKHLEFALSNNPKDETYFFQQVAETINNPKNSLIWVGTLHQGFDSYAFGASERDILEWEKVSGRFVSLNFNEPATTLLKLISKRLEALKIKAKNIQRANTIAEKTHLIPKTFSELAVSGIETSPFDSLTAYFAINLLQKYGQNERSVFSFLNAEGPGSLHRFDGNFYSSHDLVTYAIERLSHFIFSNNNPDKLMWEAAERAIQRGDSHSDITPSTARLTIRTVLLANIFGREGSAFDIKSLKDYIECLTNKDEAAVVDKLVDKNILQFLRHKGKVVFVEGTDVNLLNELRIARKKLSAGIDLTAEVAKRINIAPRLSRGHFIEKGTPRFFHFVFHHPTLPKNSVTHLGNGVCHLYFFGDDPLWGTGKGFPEVCAILHQYDDLLILAQDILLHDVVLDKYSDDLVVKQLVSYEKNHVETELESLTLSLLSSATTQWIAENGTNHTITNTKDLNEFLRLSFDRAYKDSPRIFNELVNQQKLAIPINTARKNILGKLCERTNDPTLDLPEKRFPAEKSIFLSTWVDEGMYSFETGLLSSPKQGSSYSQAWAASLKFLNESEQGKVNLVELFATLRRAPYGMKNGLLSYWVPMFLLTYEDHFALYYNPEDKYLPYLSTDIFESIVKKPSDFSIKKFNFNGVSQATLNQYKVIAKVEERDSDVRGTYLSIFTNFILLQRSLNSYSKRTNTISSEARALRDAVENASDPETALFEKIPNAIGFHTIANSENPSEVQEYFRRLQIAARELAESFSELLNRLFHSIRGAFGADDADFDTVKSIVVEELMAIERNSLHTRLRTILERLVSPLDDLESWVKSVADATLGRSLESLRDEEEGTLHRQIKESIEALLAHKGIAPMSPDALAVSVTLRDGTTHRRFVEPQQGNDRLRERLEGLDSNERMQLISIILQTENQLVSWD
jgi:hypothetical protein